jgi:hypothetical protein
MKTFIGQLIFRLRTEGLGETKKVTDAMRNVEAAAKRLGSTGTGTWGVGFQRQIDKLKLTADEIKQVERAWIQLHSSMRSRNLSGALKSAEVGHWKTNTISALAQSRAEMERHFHEAEKSARGHSKRMQDILKPALVMLGAYTVPYLTGVMGQEALTASSERRREVFRQRMAGISPKDQETLFSKSEEIGRQYPSVPITGIMEMARSAFSVMGDAERAVGIVERMAQALVVLQSARGTDAAARNLIGLIRGLDNLGVNKDGQQGIDQVNDMIDAATRAAQVDPDFDAEKFFQFARATKTAGPALSMDFLARSPVFIQDGGDGATGNALAMGFRAFALEAVGSAGGKKYLNERDRIGIRKNGKLVDENLFGSDPDKWVLKYLVPALQKDGVDMNNDTAVAAAVGRLSGNTTATGFLTRIITQREQIERWLKLMDGTKGTEIAKDVRYEDPFVGWESFKTSLQNLSAALVPIDAINAGLNALANGINMLANVAKDNPMLTMLGIGATGVGAYQGGKFVMGALGDLFGLKSSAVALDGSAAALTRAAVALGGESVAGNLPGDGKKPPKKGGGFFGLNPWAVLTAIGATLSSDTPVDQQTKDWRDDPRAERWIKEQQELEEKAGAIRIPVAKTFLTGPAGGTSGAIEMDAAQRARGAGMTAFPGKVADDLNVGLNSLAEQSRVAGQQIEQNLSVTAKPEVDTSAIDMAIAKASRLLSLLQNVAGASERANSSVNAEMRRNFADGGGGW